MQLSDKRLIVREADKLASKIGFRFGLSPEDKKKLSESFMNAITELVDDEITIDDRVIARYVRKPLITKVKKDIKKEKAVIVPRPVDPQKMERLMMVEKQIKEITKDHFPGRIYTQKTLDQLRELNAKREQLLRNEY